MDPEPFNEEEVIKDALKDRRSCKGKCHVPLEEFKSFVANVGVAPCEACEGPEEKLPCDDCQGLDCGNCKIQLDADAAHLVAWENSRRLAGFEPTDEEITEELERYIYNEDTLLINAARARKGL